MQVLRGTHHIQNRPGVNPDEGSILHTTFGYACFGRILEPMLVEAVEVAVRPASVYQQAMESMICSRCSIAYDAKRLQPINDRRPMAVFHCLILGFATEYSKSVKKFTNT